MEGEPDEKVVDKEGKKVMESTRVEERLKGRGLPDGISKHDVLYLSNEAYNAKLKKTFGYTEFIPELGDDILKLVVSNRNNISGWSGVQRLTSVNGYLYFVIRDAEVANKFLTSVSAAIVLARFKRDKFSSSSSSSIIVNEDEKEKLRTAQGLAIAAAARVTVKAEAKAAAKVQKTKKRKKEDEENWDITENEREKQKDGDSQEGTRKSKRSKKTVSYAEDGYWMREEEKEEEESIDTVCKFLLFFLPPLTPSPSPPLPHPTFHSRTLLLSLPVRCV